MWQKQTLAIQKDFIAKISIGSKEEAREANYWLR
jgi:hypothetical protein